MISLKDRVSLFKAKTISTYFSLSKTEETSDSELFPDELLPLLEKLEKILSGLVRFGLPQLLRLFLI